MKRLLAVITTVSIVIISMLSYFLVKETGRRETMTKFSQSCVVSFMNSVDYILCHNDVDLGNVRAASCESYLDTVVDDKKTLVNLDLGFDVSYNHIGVK